MNQNKTLIKEAFAKIIENMQPTEEVYQAYFSKDYIQYVNGEVLDYHDLITHMKTQKKALESAQIQFKQIIAEGNKIATIHIVNAIKKDGRKVTAQVNAVFEIKDNKIISCDELTHLIHGDEEDRDLGSRK